MRHRFDMGEVIQNEEDEDDMLAQAIANSLM
jgi:hypothetical protein